MQYQKVWIQLHNVPHYKLIGLLIQNDNYIYNFNVEFMNYYMSSRSYKAFFCSN
jgi:hypothetical protein